MNLFLTRSKVAGLIACIIVLVFSINVFAETTNVPITNKMVVVTTDNSNVRSIPSTTGAKITSLPIGTMVTVTHQADAWYKIKLKDGKVGYIAGWLLDVSGKRLSASSIAINTGAIKPSSDVTSDQTLTYKYQSSGETFTFMLTGSSRILADVVSSKIGITIYTDGTQSSYNNNDTEPVNDKQITGIMNSSTNNAVTFRIGTVDKLSYTKTLSDDGKTLTIKVTNPAEIPIDDNIVIEYPSADGVINGKVVVIDPGHGGRKTATSAIDPGATNGSLLEKDINYDVAIACGNYLKSKGATVIYTRTKDYSGVLTLEQRAAVANNLNADIFVSCHSNSNTSSSPNGTATYYYAAGDTANQLAARKHLASLVQQELISSLGRKNNGTPTAAYVVLKKTTMPSILVETAFMSNPTEKELLMTQEFRTKAGQAIAKGICNYLLGK